MVTRTTEIKNKKERLAHAPYTSKIIKAGALLADAKTLLSHWDVMTSVQENLERMRRENLFGKASRSRVKEWSTKSVRYAFFASPKFPCLLNAESMNLDSSLRSE